MLKRMVAKAADAMGYVITPKWRLGSPLVLHLRELFAALDIECVVDVGANIGQYRAMLRSQVGYKGPVISVEPIPQAVAQLRARAAGDGQSIIEECALGAASGTATLNVTNRNDFSSLLTPDHSKVKDFIAENTVREQITVVVKTLDELMAKYVGYRRVYLKLDTQGYDLEVLKGAAQTLKISSALQTEASVKPIYFGMPDYATAFSTITALGYDLSGMFPIVGFPALIEFDAVFVRRQEHQQN